jgi:hypothetical protein
MGTSSDGAVISIARQLATLRLDSVGGSKSLHRRSLETVSPGPLFF